MLIEKFEKFSNQMNCCTFLRGIAEENQRTNCFKNEETFLSFNVSTLNMNRAYTSSVRP